MRGDLMAYGDGNGGDDDDDDNENDDDYDEDDDDNDDEDCKYFYKHSVRKDDFTKWGERK